MYNIDEDVASNMFKEYINKINGKVPLAERDLGCELANRRRVPLSPSLNH